MTMTIARAYDHRTFGRIGTVELVVNESDWTLNGQPLGPRSVEYLATFALQSLQDAYAGAESAEEAITDFESKRDRVIDGTIGTRAAGVGAFRTIARQLARAAIKAENANAFKDLDDDAVNTMLDARIDAKLDAYKAAVTEELERRAAERKAKAAIASKL